MGGPEDSLEISLTLNSLPNEWFIRVWLLILGIWLPAQEQCCVIPGVGRAGSCACLIGEVETPLPVCRITPQTSKIETEAYHILWMNNNWFNIETLDTCLPLCLLFSRLAARKEVMPWTLPLTKWPRRPETCAGRWAVGRGGAGWDTGVQCCLLGICS